MVAMTRPAQRHTKQRAEVIAILKQTYGFRSAQQLHADLRSGGSRIGLATVYRNLDLLAQAGDVNTIRSEDGETLYRLCEDEEHHHHIICRDCGRIEKLDAAEFEEWVSKVAREHGFTDISHHGDLFGLCADCTDKRSR